LRVVGRLSTLNREGVGFEISAEKASGMFGSSKARGVDAEKRCGAAETGLWIT